jgi:hypothetical protein
MEEKYEFYPGFEREEHQLEKVLLLEQLLQEIREVVLYRSDGVHITLGRDAQFPKHREKNLLTNIKIETWDIAARPPSPYTFSETLPTPPGRGIPNSRFGSNRRMFASSVRRRLKTGDRGLMGRGRCVGNVRGR